MLERIDMKRYKTIWYRALNTFLFLCVAVAVNAQKDDKSKRPFTSRDLVDVTNVVDLSISPNGEWVFYRSSKQGLDSYVTLNESWLVGTTGTIHRRLKPMDELGGLQWSPDSSTMAGVATRRANTQKDDSILQSISEIQLVNISDLSTKTLITSTQLVAGFESLELKNIGEIKWSPNGKSIAFVIGSRERVANIEKASLNTTNPDRIYEVDVEPPLPPVGQRPAGLLCVLDIESGKVRRLTDRTLDVVNGSFDWSPDGTRLVFAAASVAEFTSRLGFTNGGQRNLYIVNSKGRVETLVKQNGTGHRWPRWSPDGNWISFEFTRDIDGDQLRPFQIGVIPASGGDAKLLTSENNEGIHFSEIFWSPDSRYIYFDQEFDMRSPLFRVSLSDGRIMRATPDHNNYRRISASADGKSIAFVSSATNEPPDIYVSSMSFTEKKKLTDLNPQLKRVEMPIVEKHMWRSADDQWDIHGVLLKPHGYQVGKRYPLIICLQGGPGMVSLEGFGLTQTFPAHQLAARGYLVLSVNNRGRPGYGWAFSNAERDEKAYAWSALHDITSAVDYMIKRGIADPDRVGIGGHSYGARLTANIIVQTNRFKAAWISDLTSAQLLEDLRLFGGPLQRADSQRRLGISSPAPSPEDIKRLFEQGAIYSIYKVKTPTLLHCGETSQSMTRTNHGVGGNGCRQYFSGLRAYNVPSELRVWAKAGHQPRGQLQTAETHDQVVEWFDFWVRGLATERMAKRYGPPKNADSTATAASSPKS